MQQQKIKISVENKLSLYKAYLLSLQAKIKLTNGERDVLSMVMYYNDRKFDIDKEDRYSLIFSAKNKVKMSSELGISKNVLENRLSSLRGKGYLNKNNELPVYLDNRFVAPFTITYEIEVKPKKDGSR